MRPPDDRPRWPWRRAPGMAVGSAIASEMLGEQLTALLDAVADGRHWQGEVPFLREDGRTESVWVTATPGVGNRPDTASMGLVVDTSLRDAAQALVAHHASHDALTELPNRAALIGIIDAALRVPGPISAAPSLVLLDIGSLDVVSEAFGHEFGERVVLRCAEALASLVHPGDRLARCSDHVFAVWCSHSSSSYEAEVHGEGLRSALARRYDLAGVGVALEVSAGIAAAPPGGADAAEVLQRAGTALRRARLDHTTRVYDAVMRHELLRQVELEALVARILVQGEVDLAYQPVVRLDDRVTVGAEALLRVVDGDGRPVPPMDLVEAAERIGRIDDLGELILRTACAAAAGWHRTTGRAVHVAVNLSARQLADPTLPRRVAAALGAAGLDPAALCLEITETVLMADPARSAALLAELKAQRVRVAADDFGTGYSSLAYLKAFPLDALKVDRAFVGGMPHDLEQVAITRAIVAMADALGLLVVAEGVEREDQRSSLLRLGAGYGQGFLWSRAVPANELEARLMAESHLVAGTCPPLVDQDSQG